MKSSRFNFIILMLAVFLYFGFKISGKPAVGILAVIMIIIAGIYRFIYDWRHDSFPWKKNKEARQALARNRIEKAQAKADRIKSRKSQNTENNKEK